jgi:alpha-L-fucosidase
VTVPRWWNERRYGLRLHASIATVPSFAPIGESAEWYWAHLGSDALAGTAPHPSPMAEVLAYHADRWAHVEHFDDFLPFLSYHRFDADEQVELALDAGMNYVVQDTKHHDGLCWWEASGTKRTTVLNGPQRDVTAEIAEACRRNGVVFGTAYSLLDWADQHDPAEHLVDLVERYGTEILWGFGAGPAGRPDWDANPTIDRALDVADAQGSELAFNDGWGIADSTFRTVRHRPPSRIDLHPWELSRPLGSSACHNRAETADHLLSTGALLDVLTEVVAKGGNLLLEVGPSVDGTITEIQKRPLREVGRWVTEHADLIHAGRPFDQWGDAQIRYVRVRSRHDVTDDIVAIDLAAGPEVVLAGLTPDRYDVSSIEADDGGSLHWEQHRGGVAVNRIDRSPAGLAGTYRIRLHPVPAAIRLFEEREAHSTPLQPMLDGSAPGEIVHVPDGRFDGPIVVPPDVVLRGGGWDRAAVTGGVVLAAGARIEGIDIGGAVVLGAGGSIVGCRCDATIEVAGDDASVLSVVGPGVVGTADRTTVERCTFQGAGEGVGVDLSRGSGHRVHRNEIVDHLAGVHLTEVSASSVSENRIGCRWWGVRLTGCDHVEVVENTIQHTMRSIDVDGGNGSIVNGNWIADGDSGAVVQFGANDTSVVDNHVERCRVGVVVWDAPTSSIGPNTFVDLHEEAPVVHGPDGDD